MFATDGLMVGRWGDRLKASKNINIKKAIARIKKLIVFNLFICLSIKY